MKMIHYNRWLACMAVALLLAACTADDEYAVKDESTVVYPEIHLGVSDMTMTAVSRAADPMSPDEEKYIETLAVFEFDNEGMHIKGPTTYHFIDFLAGTVDGSSGVGDIQKTEFGVVETTLKDIAFEKYTGGTICLVANVLEDSVLAFYEKYREPEQTYGRMTLDKFKTWTLPFQYKEIPKGTYNESTAGHLEDMYMFGYYEGPIDSESDESSKPENIRVDLGRLASRLDITVVNETGGDLDKRLGYHFDNVCKSAYFFPIKMGVPPTFGAGQTRTVICSGDEPVEGDTEEYKIVPRTFKNGASHTRYFYVAAHSAKGEEDATKLHLFYDRKIVDDDTTDDSKSIRVPMCNVHPSEADKVTNGYSLSRNTRYHFTIRLRSKAAAASEQAVASRSVEYGEQLGDIIVYLP
ncbi:hypothetical protein AB9N12_18980 [Bacteroides sp. AN502(2024)]|uniref:hypothetical protein n=1 Tax=Bacteroides sp. AN502(2024) TaxID=3160599 RepID=UPI0035127B1D